MKRVLLVLGLVTMFSCEKSQISDEVQIIDECEYIVFKNSRGNGLTHKGNCKNKIHIYNEK
jgi:hypothetical protein